MPHLLAAVSGHGFGHVAQSAPVLNALYRALPGLRLTIRTGASRPFLESRMAVPFTLDPHADDFGMRQHSALELDLGGSAAAYRTLHGQWEANVDAVAKQLKGLAPDLVFADVPYLTLAAAARADIPAVALCCLNWAGIYGPLFRHRPEAPAVRRQMLQAYNGAALFLRTEPAMPMPELGNVETIGPVGAVGENRRALVDARIGSAGERLVLVATGGFDSRVPVEAWPVLPGVRYLVPESWGVEKRGITPLERCGCTFSDLLASCDLFITKPGYGSFVEAAAAAVPVLYVRRNDWPEEPYLIDWLERVGNCREIAREQFMAGELRGAMEALLSAPAAKPVALSGTAQAVERIAALL